MNEPVLTLTLNGLALSHPSVPDFGRRPGTPVELTLRPMGVELREGGRERGPVLWGENLRAEDGSGKEQATAWYWTGAAPGTKTSKA